MSGPVCTGLGRPVQSHRQELDLGFSVDFDSCSDSGHAEGIDVIFALDNIVCSG
jgi:hypothetical protein